MRSAASQNTLWGGPRAEIRARDGRFAESAGQRVNKKRLDNLQQCVGAGQNICCCKIVCKKMGREKGRGKV